MSSTSRRIGNYGRTAELRNLQCQFAEALTAAGTSGVALIRESGQLPALQRIEIYRRNSRYTLRRCLEKTYPLTKLLLGAEVFAEATRSFVVRHPSQHRSLDAYGESFGTFLREKSRQLGLSAARAAIAADAAKLERCLATIEKLPLITESGLVTFLALSPAAQEKALIACRPNLMLVSLDYPVELARRKYLSKRPKLPKRISLRRRRRPAVLALSVNSEGICIRNLTAEEALILRRLRSRPVSMKTLAAYASRHRLPLPATLKNLFNQVYWPPPDVCL